MATLQLTNEGLKTPSSIVGSYSKFNNKTLLIGHSTTVFDSLDKVKIGDNVEYSDNNYKVKKIEYLEKAEINMNELLKEDKKDTIVIMTCAGELLENGDATERLIITASNE